MPVNLTSRQEARVFINYRDAANNAAIVDGEPVWAIANTEVATIEATATPGEYLIKATGVLGTTEVIVTADADLSPNVRELITVDTVNVVAGEAVAGDIVFGEPVDQPEPPVEPIV